MEQEIKFVNISKNDVKALQQISSTTYSDAFTSSNTTENMTAYLDFAFSEQKLLEEISNENSTFYFAKQNNQTVGYFKINFGNAQTELKDAKGMELERIYILKEFQGKKIGEVLLLRTIDIALENKMDYIWLGVWEKNQKAISFYEKHKFITASSHAFFMGNDEQRDLIMKRELA